MKENLMPSEKILLQCISRILICSFSFLLLYSCPEGSFKPDNTSDTTSHNFIWEVDTLGNFSSYLEDVTIVDENNIWAVGYLRVDDPDSSFDGTGQETFNAAHWDGEKWELIRIVNPSPLYSVCHISDNDIWVTTFGLPIHWNGAKWKLYHIQNMGIDASAGFGIWASSPEDVWFVGYKGSIVHYDGLSFRKISTNSDTPIKDVWGINSNHVWAVSNTSSMDDEHPDGYESVVFFWDGNQLIRKYEALTGHRHDYSHTVISGYMNTVWAFQDTLYISSYSGLWKESISNSKGYLDHGPDKLLNGRPFLVRGTGYNDVFAFTHWGEFLHYNGRSWLQDLSVSGTIINGAAVKGNVVVLVGDLRFTRAIVFRGHHVN